MPAKVSPTAAENSSASAADKTAAVVNGGVARSPRHSSAAAAATIPYAAGPQLVRRVLERAPSPAKDCGPDRCGCGGEEKQGSARQHGRW